MSLHIDRMLQSIGKRCYRNCYHVAVAKGEVFDVVDLLECDPEFNGTSYAAQRTRVSKIKSLIRDGLGADALSRY